MQVISPQYFVPRYAHDLEKRQQAVRQGTVKKLSRSETHSSTPKIAFPPQDDGVSFPGGIASSSSAPPNAVPYPDDPPAYSVSEATEMVGGSGGPGGSLGYGPAHEQQVKKRRVPPPPSNSSSKE